MSKIKVIQPEQATGRLKEIYDDLLQKRGKIAAVHKIQSLRPESIVKHMDLYMEIMYKKSELSRAEREMVAVVVSAANNCEYCQIHHAEALLHYWKDEDKVARLRKNFRDLELPQREHLLCEYAALATKQPDSENKHLDALRREGLSDSTILDATLVIAYFNFVNRIVLLLGVNPEKNAGKGFKY